MMEYIAIVIVAVIGVILLLSGLKRIRPTHVAALETFGKYTGQKTSGLTYVIPFVQELITINITEQMVDVQRQDVITKENLNCETDAQVYYKVNGSEENMKKALYNVNDVNRQMVQLAKSTLRAVIGQKMFKEVNSARQQLNDLIFKELVEETKNWGVEVVRVELKEIFPPKHVQDTMDQIIMAENEKDKQADLARAKVIAAEGEKKAAIISAEGRKQADILNAESVKQQTILRAEAEKENQILVADGEALAIQKVADATAHATKVTNTALTTYFVDSAIVHKQLETTEKSFAQNSKIITDGKTPFTLIENQTSKQVIPTDTSKKEPDVMAKYREIFGDNPSVFYKTQKEIKS